MIQYLELLKTIKEKGTYKAPARENMPGTTSLFGYQMRFDLQEGFPLLTTKKLSFKNIITELLWFLRGDTNIKFLVDNGCNIWNEDAYNYYLKVCKIQKKEDWKILEYEDFIKAVKDNWIDSSIENYTLGDCGKQYGWLMRNLKTLNGNDRVVIIDQIDELIKGLKANPMGRRHIVNNWNIGTLNDMALNACHAFIQFNCRSLSDKERVRLYGKVMSGKASRLVGDFKDINDDSTFFLPKEHVEYLDEYKIPRYCLDCQMYQRSADVFLGVPYNIASYALLTEIIAKICNMAPGNFIHTFGDVHIYEDHLSSVEEQLTREPRELPKLKIKQNFKSTFEEFGLDRFINNLDLSDFQLENYNPHSSIKAKLSTGLK